MILKELNLIGFGKFKNKKIDLEDGINLVYGENEAGKSTLHSFIDGMFYGFLKPNVKSALYLEEHEKYNPWDKSRYAGVIKFNYKGKDYRVERDFAKGEENTIVIDETTGADITKNIETGSTRILQPGIHFFGFNTRIFDNTISIKQLGTKTDDKLANEVTEKLINVTTSLDDNISVEKAIGELKNKMAEIGTDRAPTKPYAKNIRDIERLEYEMKDVLSEKDSYESYLEEERRLKNIINMEEKDLSSLKDKLTQADLLKKTKKLQEAKILSYEINKIEEKASNLSIYKKLSMEDYKKAINLNNSIEYINSTIEESTKDLEAIEQKLQSMEDSATSDADSDNLEEIIKDYNKYEELEEERNRILYSKEDNSLEFHKRDYQDNKDKVSKYKTIKITSIILAIIALGLGIMAIISKKHQVIGILFPIFGVIGGYYSNKIKTLEAGIMVIEKKIENILFNRDEKQKRIEEIDKMQGSLLEKYNLGTKFELKRLLDKAQMTKYNQDEQIAKQKELRLKHKGLGDKIRNNLQKKEDNLKALESIFNENNVLDLQEFGQGLDKKTIYENSIKELDAKRELLIMVLGQNTIESLTEELEKHPIDFNMSEDILDENQIRYEIDRYNQNIQDNKIALKGVEENLKRIEKSIEKLVEIEEDIYRKKLYKEELELKLKALQLASDTIEELSKDIHSQFAPAINKKVSEIVDKITDGKYSNIKISEELSIKVENPNTGEIIDINSLSGGTIDQLYFSLRFGIVNSMVEDALPLILDDCFIQYDDLRLKNIMEFLQETSNERQIILFTCHKREKRILDDLGFRYNLINLS